MARPKLKIDKEAWLQAIRDTGGMITLMAPLLGIHRETIAKYRDEVEWIKQAFADIEEETLDVANRTMQIAVKENYKAAAWYLERKGKHRGFGKEIKVDAKLTQKAVFHIHLPDNGRGTKKND